MADHQHPPPSRPGSLNMPTAIPGRRSNLRLAFPCQGRQNNDRPTNNLDFPASGYPTTQMHPPPPPLPPPRSSSTNTSNWPAVSSHASSSSVTFKVPAAIVGRNTNSPAASTNSTSTTQHPNVITTPSSPKLSNSHCRGMRTLSPARPQSLSPSRSPQNLSPARPRNLSLGGLQNSSPGETQNFSSGVIAQNQPVGSQQNIREHKKKHLVLHLPPPHNHHHPHHHHSQHRHGIIHHEGVRERGHKR